MKTLTLENLAPYLPYGLIGITKNGGKYILGVSSNMRGSGMETRDIGTFIDNQYKPLLYPLSSLTKEITHKGESFVPMQKLAEEALPGYKWKMNGIVAVNNEGEHFFYNDCFDSFIYVHGVKEKSVPNQLPLFQKMYEWHFALNIPEELYIDVETIENPYK